MNIIKHLKHSEQLVHVRTCTLLFGKHYLVHAVHIPLGMYGMYGCSDKISKRSKKNETTRIKRDTFT